MAKPAYVPKETYNRRYYVSETAITKLRDRLVEQGKPNPSASDRELGNSLDEATAAAMDAKKCIEYKHEGFPQFAVDIEEYFGVSLSVIVALNEIQSSTHRHAIITVKDGAFYKYKTRETEAEASRFTLGDMVGKNVHLPAAVVQGKPKETGIITYHKDGKTIYEERALEEVKIRLGELVDEGVAPSGIRLWRQVKTKVRLDFDL